MSKLEDKYRALKQSKKLLEELCDPGKTPRVPSMVRDRARSILKNYPNDYEIDTIARTNTESLENSSRDEKILKIVR